MTRFQTPTVQAALIGAAFVLSFIWIPSLELAAAALVLTLLTLALLCVPPRGWQKMALPRSARILTGLLTTFCALLWARAFTSDVPALSLAQASYYTLPALITAALIHTGHAPAARTVLLRIGVVLLGGLGAFAALQPILFSLPYDDRALWPLADPNHLGTVMTVSILLGLVLLNTPQKKIGLVLALACFAGLMATGSRGALLALLVSSPFLIWAAKIRWPFERTTTIGLALVVMGGITVFAALRPPNANTMLRLIELAGAWQHTDGSRPLFWGAITDLALMRPLTGFGTATFPAVYPQVMTAAHVTGGYAAHNDPLQLFLELGIAGPVLYYLIALTVLIGTVVTLRHNLPEDRRLQMAGSAAALLALGVHSHIEFALGVLPLMTLIGLALGFWAQAVGEPNPASVSPDSKIRAVQIGFLLATLLSLTQLTAEAWLYSADRALQNQKVDHFAADLERARFFSFDLASGPYLRTAAFRTSLMQSGLPVTPDKIGAAEDALKQVLIRNPYLSGAYETQGNLDRLQHKDPLPAWREGLRLDPRNAALRLAIAQEYDRRDDPSRTLAFFDETLAWQNLRGPVPSLYAFMRGWYVAHGNTDSLHLLSVRENWWAKHTAHTRTPLVLTPPGP